MSAMVDLGELFASFVVVVACFCGWSMSEDAPVDSCLPFDVGVDGELDDPVFDLVD